MSKIDYKTLTKVVQAILSTPDEDDIEIPIIQYPENNESDTVTIIHCPCCGKEFCLEEEIDRGKN